jgi:hypothetical protein
LTIEGARQERRIKEREKDRPWKSSVAVHGLRARDQPKISPGLCGSIPCSNRRKEEIRPGDVIWCPPGVKHWHGATATTAMSHIAIVEKLNGKAVDWMEKVSDEHYQAELKAH